MAQIFFAGEAIASLYHADQDGDPVLDAPIWFGACIQSIEAEEQYQNTRVPGTGMRYVKEIQTDGEHIITIGRVWALEGASLRDFKHLINRRYVLRLHWKDPANQKWYQRDYHDCTLQGRSHQSNGVLEILDNQRFRSTHYEESDGSGLGGALTLCDTFTQTPFGFFYENELEDEEYFLGHYAWAQPVTLKDAKVIAEGGSGSVTCSLEVNGSLTGLTIAIPSGAGEVEATAGLGDYAVSAGDEVRWKVTSAPSPGGSAKGAAIVMQVS